MASCYCYVRANDAICFYFMEVSFLCTVSNKDSYLSEVMIENGYVIV